MTDQSLSWVGSLLGVTILCSCLSWHAATTKRKSVEVPGTLPVEKKMLVAQHVVESLETLLHDRIRDSLPGIPDQQLDSLEIRPTRVLAKSIGSDSTISVDTVYIECRVRSSWGDEIADRAIAICAQEVSSRFKGSH